MTKKLPVLTKLYNITPDAQPVVPVNAPARSVPPGDYIELEDHEAKDLAAGFPDRFALKLPKTTHDKD